MTIHPSLAQHGDGSPVRITSYALELLERSEAWRRLIAKSEAEPEQETE
jgi:hypothetical protein